MMRIISSGRLWTLEKHEEDWREMLGRIQKARESFKGVPALEELLWYIENGKEPKNRSFRDHFISLAEKMGWEYPKHLKE